MTPSAAPTTSSANQQRKRAFSGMRPTGALHLGHYFGVIRNWVTMQNDLDVAFSVVDWHALTSEYENPLQIRQFIPEMVKDWLVSGLDPEKSIIFQQSQVKENAELHLLLSMITPVSWLERCPTYKEMRQQLSEKDLSTYGFLGYPVLMTADILQFRAHYVPVGQDQIPHVEMSREICRRFNHLYGDYFPEPEVMLTPSAKCPGLDGRKMSKSYNNTIQLREKMDTITPKVKAMLTDTARVRRSDPGNPQACNLYPYHELLTDEETRKEIQAGCTSAQLGCVDCKNILLKGLEKFLTPLHERRVALDNNPQLIWDILEHGNERARVLVGKTLEGVREKIGF